MSAEETTIEALKRWSHILLWVSVILPLLGAIAAGARYYVERYEKRLSSGLVAKSVQEARQDASSARVELNELKSKTAPRTISEKQREVLLPLAAKLKGKPVAVACRLMDGESCDYAAEIVQVLKDAGCVVPDLIKTSLNDFPGHLAITGHGNSDAETIKNLTSGFNAVGIPTKIEVVKENSVGMWYPNVVHVIMGRKT
jgi:hypothetical protein